MKNFTDDEMGQLLPTAKSYSIAILKRGPKYGDDASAAIIWEHGRRNFGLRDDGVLAVVLPVTDGSEVCGVGVFAATVQDTIALMNEDPGVSAGRVHFRGAPLPGVPGGCAALSAAPLVASVKLVARSLSRRDPQTSSGTRRWARASSNSPTSSWSMPRSRNIAVRNERADSEQRSIASRLS